MVLRTHTELGQHFKRSRSAVGKWVRHRNWPCKRIGPWSGDDLPKIAAFVATLAPNRNEDRVQPYRSPEERAARKRLLCARADRLEVENANLRRKYMPLAAAQRRARGALAAIEREHAALVERLPAILLATPDGQRGNVLRTEFNALRERFANGDG